MHDTRAPAAEARPASTVVMVRPGGSSGSPESLFVVRPGSMKAFGGFHVFPGGVVDPDDHSDAAAAVSTITPEQAEEAIAGDAGGQPALGFFVCALRELFEEVGILLVVADGRSQVELSEAELARARRKLDQGTPLPKIVSEMGLQLATHLLDYRARWLAPKALPVRFDLRVFVALASGDPHPDPREVERIEWLTSSEVLARVEAGTALMAPPTIATVNMLAASTSVEEVLGGTRPSNAGKVERHSPLVRRLVAPNASIMTGPGTNTYVVGSEGLVVIDPGSMDPGHLGALLSLGRIAHVVVTHHHPDHVSGALELAERSGAAVVASRTFWERARIGEDGRGCVDGDEIEVEGASPLVVVETPGHASDHICLWLKEERALFSGDLVLGEGTSVISPPDGNLSDYLASLEKVASLDPVRLYPGHFDPRDDARSWIDYYMSHRREREGQILEVLGKGERSLEEIVASVYASYPKQLHPIAERSVAAHLDKLRSEGRILKAGDRYRASG